MVIFTPDVRNKLPAEIVHTAPSKYHKHKKLAPKKAHKTTDILHTHKAPTGNQSIPAVKLPNQPINRPVPALRKVLLHRNGTPIEKVTGQDVQSDQNANSVPEQ